MKNILTIFFSVIFSVTFSQSFKPFYGKLIYEISNIDRPSDTTSEMTIYSIDSLVRIEAHSNIFYSQSFIKHLIKRKAYLLISVDENMHFAIQDNFEKTNDKEVDSFTISRKYIWKKKFGIRNIHGMKAKKLKLTLLKSNKSHACFYSKNYSSKYLDAYNDFPGLPLIYYIETEDGTLKYSLKKVDFTYPDYNLFGIPSNYKRVTFDEFVDILTNQE